MPYKNPETVLQHEKNILWCGLKTPFPTNQVKLHCCNFFFFFQRRHWQEHATIKLYYVTGSTELAAATSRCSAEFSIAIRFSNTIKRLRFSNTIKRCGTPPGLQTKVQHHSHYTNPPTKSCRDRRVFPPGAGGSPAVLTSRPPRQARARPPRFPPAAAAAPPRAVATPPPRPPPTEAVGCKR